MIRNLRITPFAELDVSDAASWYEEQRDGLGLEFLHELDSILQRIVQVPLQFPVIENEARRALLRRFPFSMYFRVIGDTVELIAVVHQHRDPGVWEQRLVVE